MVNITEKIKEIEDEMKRTQSTDQPWPFAPELALTTRREQGDWYAAHLCAGMMSLTVSRVSSGTVKRVRYAQLSASELPW